MPGDPITLWHALHDGAAGKFVRAHVKRSDGTIYPGSPFSLAEVSVGLHRNAGTVVFPSAPYDSIGIVYEAFDDAGFTVPSGDHYNGAESFHSEVGLAIMINTIKSRAASFLTGKVQQPVIDGVIAEIDAVTGELVQSKIKATVQTESVSGEAVVPSLTGRVECP